MYLARSMPSGFWFQNASETRSWHVPGLPLKMAESRTGGDSGAPLFFNRPRCLRSRPCARIWVRLMGITRRAAAFVFSNRWPGSMPQYTVGHAPRTRQKSEAALQRFPDYTWPEMRITESGFQTVSEARNRRSSALWPRIADVTSYDLYDIEQCRRIVRTASPKRLPDDQAEGQ